MITHFKSALNQIKAEDELKEKTEMYLRDALSKKHNTKIIDLINLRILARKRSFAIAMSLLFILICGSAGAYGYYQTPASYLSIDINPSVELGINTFGKIVKAEAYNDDGQKILIGINVKGSDISEAVNELITSAVENGYIKEEGTVISITSETDDENTAKILETDAENGANEALKTNGKTAVIYIDNVALNRREEARTLGITAGKLNLIEKLQSVDPTATVEQYKNASVKDIMKGIKSNKNNENVKDEEKTELKDKNQLDTNKIETNQKNKANDIEDDKSNNNESNNDKTNENKNSEKSQNNSINSTVKKEEKAVIEKSKDNAISNNGNELSNSKNETDKTEENTMSNETGKKEESTINNQTENVDENNNEKYLDNKKNTSSSEEQEEQLTNSDNSNSSENSIDTDKNGNTDSENSNAKGNNSDSKANKKN